MDYIFKNELKSVRNNNKVVFDIGANVGCTTNYFAKISKETWHHY